MPVRSASLNGNVPHNAKRVLILIDTINDMEWPGAAGMLREALRVAEAIRKLKAKAVKHGIPVIYLNDNFGQWRSDFQTQVNHCLNDGCAGQPITEMLQPTPLDYFVLKPKHSGFYASPLTTLLEHMRAKELILTGFTAESCVLITAVEAYVRGFKIIVPADCVASQDRKTKNAALHLMRNSLHASVPKTLARIVYP